MTDRFRPSYRGSDLRTYGHRSYDRNRFGDRESADDHFVFRGAAHHSRDMNNDRYESDFRRNDYRRQEEQFTFSARNLPTTHFPSPEEHRYSNSKEAARRTGANEQRRSGTQRRGERTLRHRGSTARRVFRPKAANSREILSRSVRDTTPELLSGMSQNGFTRFKVTSSEESSAASNDDSDVNEALIEHPSKKVKIGSPAAVTTPRWSNPDPYTVLPPPETLGAPKRDIVQVIRKAKADTAPQSDKPNLVSQNVDFISFDIEGDDVRDNNDGNVTDDAGVTGQNEEQGGLHRHRQMSGGYSKSQDSEVHSQELDFSPIESISTATNNLGHVPPMEHSIPLPTGEDYYISARAPPKSKKRKSPGDAVGEILLEWHPDSDDTSPWCSGVVNIPLDPALRLHVEICDFFEYAKPDPVEESARRDLVYTVERAIRQSNLPLAKSTSIQSFGSFAAGLYLPTADMDLVAVTQSFMESGIPSFCQSRNQLHKLGANLRHMARPGDLSVVAWARVPIVKFTDRRTGIKVDISVENRTGIDAVRTFQEWKSKYPAMPVLVMLVKQLLAMRGLNEVFSGGIGGFTIICLVTSMLQLMPEQQVGGVSTQARYGDLLLRFLDLYGNRFDIRRTGICMNPPSYFDKRHNPMPKQSLNRLTIQDPNNPANDISGGSHRIELVLEVFRVTHAQLQRRLDAVSTGNHSHTSILEAIIGGNYASFNRHRAHVRGIQEPRRLRAIDQDPVPRHAEAKSTHRAPGNFGLAEWHGFYRSGVSHIS